MLIKIKQFFTANIAVQRVAGGTERSIPKLQIAAAALLVEVMRADHQIADEERESVKSALLTVFGLDSDTADELFELANEEVEQAVSYFEFTSLINNDFDAPQKAQIIELMWDVVYADGDVDKYEEAVVRKVADLLYVPHGEFIAAKHRARDRCLAR